MRKLPDYLNAERTHSPSDEVFYGRGINMLHQNASDESIHEPLHKNP